MNWCSDEHTAAVTYSVLNKRIYGHQLLGYLLFDRRGIFRWGLTRT
jgi:hypothetical protein